MNSENPKFVNQLPIWLVHDAPFALLNKTCFVICSIMTNAIMFWIPGCETLKLMMKKLWLIWKLFDRIFYSVCIWHYTNCIWPPISCTYDLVNGSCFNAIQATHVGLDVAARTVYQSKHISSNQNKQTSVKWQMLELVHMHTCRLFQQEMDSHKSHYCFVEMRVPALNIFAF